MVSIQKIKRKDLNLTKYTEALRSSVNYRVYAEAWYLDAVTNSNWECWIWGDYEALMPIPFQYKFGMKFVTQPIYCQQLGVFYKKVIPKELFRAFEQKIHRYWVRAYHFNEENTRDFQPKGTHRLNYVLDLRSNFEELFQNFEKDRKKDYRRIQKLEVEISSEEYLDNYFELLKTEYVDLAKELDLNYTKKLFQIALQQKALKFYSLKENDDLLAITLFLESQNRKILIASSRNKSLEKKGMQAFLLMECIKKWAAGGFSLDFEGSMIKGIADYNKSFGAQAETYTVYRNLPQL